MKTYLTMDEAADICGVSSVTIWSWIFHGKIKAIQKNSVWLTTKDWIDGYTHKTTSHKSQGGLGSSESRRLNLWKKYKLTIEDVELMIDNQGGGCAICGHSDRKSNTIFPCVDHCHDTGRVRGVLCQKCNAGIGLLGDDITTIERALEYLNRHK